jgi:hypothetical protein
VNPLPEGARLGRFEIVDDKGRSATYESGGFDDSSFDVKRNIPNGANWLIIRIGLAKIRASGKNARAGFGREGREAFLSMF